ncbi:MAG: glycosyltransferase [Halomonas sp.]
MPSILYVGTMCLLDQRSGAALSLLRQLTLLAEAGWQVGAVSATLCDGQAEYSRERLLGPVKARQVRPGQATLRKRDGVDYHLLVTASSVGKRLATQEARDLLALAEKVLAKASVDIVVTYGDSVLCRALRQRSRRHARRLAFYLANAEYHSAEAFAGVDAVICPSEFLAGLYRRRLGITPRVLRNAIGPGHQLPAPRDPEARDRIRRDGSITYINPSPSKGATLFFRLAQLAWKRRPDLRFLVLEGRVSLREWQAAGIDPTRMPNVEWLPNQDDMLAIYRRTSVLLFPSFWEEASGRSVGEAMLSGIPVVASRRGGVPEQLNGAGICLAIPPACEARYTHVPSLEEVVPWLDALTGLLDDPKHYAEACEAVIRAAEPMRPEVTRRATLALYAALLDSSSQTAAGGKRDG